MKAAPGDYIYFKSAEGLHTGEVKAVGRHGCTAHCDQKKTHQVPWNHLLGHKSRVKPAYRVVDQGDDGAMVEDEHGQRRFIRGGFNFEENATLTKALPAGQHSLLLDVGQCSDCCTDATLETMYKALREGDGIWAPHHDPFLTDHIETVSQWGVDRLSNIEQALLTTVRTRQLPKGGEPLAKAVGWALLDQKALDEMRAYLEGKDSATYTLDDWMLVVDWIVGTYLPPDIIKTQADYIAVRSQLIGKIQANLKDTPPRDSIKRLVAAMPVTLASIPFELKPLEQAVMNFARARAAQHISDIGEATRRRLKQLIVNHEHGQTVSDPQATLSRLEQTMRDEFGILNRDWRRVALSEAARDTNEGFVASLPSGYRVERVEAYGGACTYCQGLHGQRFTVVEPTAPNKDGETQIWANKTNLYRSASPRKREGGELVPRMPDEMWWPATGIQHPNCRGSWVKVGDPPTTIDPEFDDWLTDLLDTDSAS